jgi:hypothetical protein
MTAVKSQHILEVTVQDNTPPYRPDWNTKNDPPKHVWVMPVEREELIRLYLAIKKEFNL